MFHLENEDYFFLTSFKKFWRLKKVLRNILKSGKILRHHKTESYLGEGVVLLEGG